MVKIIKEGKLEFTGSCRACGCEFTYDLKDLIGRYIRCPFCGDIYGWAHPDQTAIHVSEDTMTNSATSSFSIPVNNGNVKPM